MTLHTARRSHAPNAAPSPTEIHQKGPRLTDSRTFADLPAAERRALPLSMRLLLRAMAVLRRRDLESYRLNLFRFGESGTA
ncbi:hypothetical protein [Streptomyces lincolnensis]|uniref:hypothetical protein n=1 Tax=Streptomyces lincolnensis TaxID=1915 RepID=UPI0037D92131